MNIINEKIISKFNFIKKNFLYILLIIIFLIGIMAFSSTLNKDDRSKANPLNVTILEEFAVDQCLSLIHI